MRQDKEQYDAGDKTSVKKRKTKAQLEQERLDEELRKVLSLYEGRSFIWWMLEQAGIYRTTFNESASLGAFQEGMRQLGLQLLARLDEVDPNAYAQMRLEALKRKERQ